MRERVRGVSERVRGVSEGESEGVRLVIPQLDYCSVADLRGKWSRNQMEPRRRWELTWSNSNGGRSSPQTLICSW